MLSLIILIKDIKFKKRESYSNTLIVTVEVSFQIRTPRDDAHGTVICRPPLSRAKKRAMLFHVRINVAIVVRTDFSSVFINQTSLSFEFKRLKLGHLNIKLDRKVFEK